MRQTPHASARLLDASGMDLVNCAGGVQYEWTDDVGVVGTDPLLMVSPDTTTR